MRRIIALVLSVLMAVLIVIPVQTFAQTENESELEEVIKAVRRKFDIPEELKFTDYYASTNERGVKTWSLTWRDKEKDISMSVGITDKGVITRYYYYEPYKEVEKKFPKVTEEEATEKAEDFIRRIAPAGTLAKIRKQDEVDGQILFLKRNYYFNYYRVVNGVPYYANNIGIDVNAETGKITSYYYNLDDSLSFPALENVISLEDAEKAYENNLGLKLIYKYYYDSKKEKINVYPVYVPKYDNGTYVVDAITGEKIRIGTYYYGYDGYGLGDQSSLAVQKEMVAKAAGVSMGPVLTPEELEAAKKQAELLTEAEAGKIVREAPEIGLDDGYKLTNVYLNKGWPERDKFIYNLSFRKEVQGETKEDYRTLYASASVNAKTGEITSFYVDNIYSEEEPKFDKEAAKAEVEKFLKSFKPEKFAETELDESKEEYEIYKTSEQKPQRYYYFRYIRQVNGIPFPDNGLYIGFDAVNGKVTNFSMNWFDVDFPSLENVISNEDAHEALFEKIGLELQYKQVSRGNDVVPLPKPVAETEAQIDENNEKSNLPQIKLVYALKSGKPLILDAYTGDILDYNGKPYKENKPAEYTDIAGHFAEEQIKTLAKYRIINFNGPEYRPDEEITQKDFFIILSKIIDKYYGTIVSEDSDADEIDDMYKQLLREGIIKEGEKSPESSVTREDAIKFLIRALKYDKVADIPGIFTVPFKDEDQIDPGLIGYVAIASGLKIISGAGGKFYPKNNLTRAEAAVMIYNYLKK
ncbi:MAG: S-layer homology domain-containing protein [Firmicutes bacterium]|nr:S-layer homology domain-containing protein [Bacillota bacterium]